VLFTSLFDFRKESIIQSRLPKWDKRNSSTKIRAAFLIRIEKIRHFFEKENNSNSLAEKNAKLRFFEGFIGK
jgi:hypothetical protein